MAKYEHLSTTTTIKFDKILRRHAYTMKLKINEVLELYQKAYLEKLEREKSKGQVKRQLITGYQVVASSQKRQTEDEAWDEVSSDGLK
jgi:hypothetical protein